MRFGAGHSRAIGPMGPPLFAVFRYIVRYLPMAWIRTVGESEATGTVARIYRGSRRSWGGVDNIIKAHSLNAAALRALMAFYNGLMHGDCDLTMAQREMIAVTVSVLNHCEY